MPAAAAKRSLVADLYNVDQTWGVFNEKITRLVDSFALIYRVYSCVWYSVVWRRTEEATASQKSRMVTSLLDEQLIWKLRTFVPPSNIRKEKQRHHEFTTVPKSLYEYLRRRTRARSRVPNLVESESLTDLGSEETAFLARHYARDPACTGFPQRLVYQLWLNVHSVRRRMQIPSIY